MTNILHTGHKRVLDQAKRFSWLSAGRRWRKSTLVTIIAITAGLRGQRVVIGTPTYDQARILMDMVLKAGVGDTKLSRAITEFDSGGRIIYRSLDDPDNARGHSADGAILDEVGDIKPEGYYDVIQPMLSDTQGWFWGVGTPRGRNWFWKEHMRAGTLNDSISWTIPVLGATIENGELIRTPHELENPHYIWEEMVKRYNNTPVDTFRQEYLAQFVQNSTSVFNVVPELFHDTQHTPSAHKGHNIVAGVDWAQSNDFTCVSIGCTDCNEEVVLWRVNKQSYQYQRKRLGALFDRWKPATIYAEENAMGVPNIEELRTDGYRVTGYRTTASSKPVLIENLVLVVEKREWKLINDSAGTAELEAYERNVSERTGRSSYGAPSGFHDDTVIARALMLQAGNHVPFEVV